MNSLALLGAFSADLIAVSKSTLIALHLVGLVFGLGAATLLDLIIVRFLIKAKVTNEYCHLIEFSSKIVTVGLVILWITGIGFLCHYALFDPVKLTNQKVWAKIVIVGILTLNGMFIHRTVLPFVASRVGHGLFDGLSGRQRFTLLSSGAVSATSWYMPLILGSFPQLNFMPAQPILIAYALLLTCAIVLTQGLAHVVLPRLPVVTIPVEEYEALLQRVAAHHLSELAPSAQGGTLIAEFRRRG